MEEKCLELFMDYGEKSGSIVIRDALYSFEYDSDKDLLDAVIFMAGKTGIKKVWVDSWYCSKENEERLKKLGIEVVLCRVVTAKPQKTLVAL